ncbi:MAG TPA: DNA repair protein RecO [Syntrophomonadaceae bacterium]|nr:DNA repair protein RecO [Syntrophomonadaceae bacterium]HQA06725.1 DNA repair protein RecO [Syntrophomonadaceae bacterium]HQE22642.1 DNA repair protein RecO [Syntrophomonadaceae bacterium]
MYYNAPVIIIKSIDFGEADKLVTVFSEQYGKLRAVARGIKKPKSSLRSCLQPFCYSQLHFYQGRDLELITQGRLLDFFGNAREDLEKTLYSVYLMELLDKSLMDRMPAPELFRLTLDTLRAINHGGLNPLLIRRFELNLAIHLGYRPVLDQCVACGQNQDLTGFNLAEGGMICRKCATADTYRLIPLSGECLAILRQLEKASSAMLTRLRASDTALDQMEHFLEQYLEYFLERQFKLKETIRYLKPSRRRIDNP